MNAPLYAAVEAGGTKFVCAVADADGELLDLARFPTRDPATTLAEMVVYFEQACARLGEFRAIGVASFGPIDLNPDSTRFGHITETPKIGWQDIDICGVLQRRFQKPLSFDTDVNAAALAELRWGAGRDVDHLVYITVGTGIGGGVVVSGHPVHGLLHPELGHLFPRRSAGDDFPGICPFHGDCFEGLASGPAISARLGTDLHGIDALHPFWALLADYLGQLCMQIVLVASPQRIVLGGGVMNQIRLFPMIRQRLCHHLGGYVRKLQLDFELDAFVVPPGLSDNAGIKGAVLLAQQASERSSF